MEEQHALISEMDAWDILREHFQQNDGLLSQLEQGRQIHLRLLPSSPIEQFAHIRELQQIKVAITVIHDSLQGKQILPKWQVCLIWRAIQRLDALVQHALQEMNVPYERPHPLPEQILSLYHLQAILFTRLHDMVREGVEPEISPAWLMHDLTIHLSSWKSFGISLYFDGFGPIDHLAFEELMQALAVLRDVWRERTMLPRHAVWLLSLIPQLSWNNKVFSAEKRRQLRAMQEKLYRLVDECVCGEEGNEKSL